MEVLLSTVMKTKSTSVLIKNIIYKLIKKYTSIMRNCMEITKLT